jgi:hypothetical protein
VTQTQVQVLDSSLNVIAPLPALYPLDKTGNILRYSDELDEFGQCTFRVSTKDTVHATYGDILVPHKNWIRIIRGGTTVWQGAIIDNLRRGAEFIEIQAATPLWYLNKILVNRSSNNPATGQADSVYRIFNSGTMASAVTAIINETITNFQGANGTHPLSSMTLGTVTNPNYPPNMTDGNSPPNKLTGGWNFGNGTTGPQLQFDFHSILYILKSMGAYTFSDFYLDNNLVFNFTPFRGNNLINQITFRWGGASNIPSNIVDYNLPRLGERMVNDLYGIAVDPNGLVLHFDQRDEGSISTYGLMQGVAAYSDVKDQATLNARVEAELPLISAPDNAAISVTLNEKGYPLGLYNIGDIVNLQITDRAISFNDNRRIVGYTVLLHNTGREMTTVQTNKVLPWQFALAGGTNQTATTT